MTTPSAPRISEEELARLEELAGKATPGPWKSRVGYGPDGFEPEGYRFVQFGPTEAKAKGLGTDQLRPADADLIAEAVNALPRLIAAARSAPGVGLDVAWAEAEAALPEGNWILAISKTDRGERRGAYEASAGNFGITPDDDTAVYDATPAAALLALAAALREPKP